MRFLMPLILSFSFCCCNIAEKKPTENNFATNPDADSVSKGSINNNQPIDPEAAVALIRRQVSTINNSTLSQKSFHWKYENCADDGTIVYYFNDKNEIVKIVETGAIGDGSWVNEYFYDHGTFIFSYKQLTGGPAGMPAETYKSRLYVYDNKVVRTANELNPDEIPRKLIGANDPEYKILKAFETKKFGEALCK